MTFGNHLVICKHTQKFPLKFVMACSCWSRATSHATSCCLPCCGIRSQIIFTTLDLNIHLMILICRLRWVYWWNCTMWPYMHWYYWQLCLHVYGGLPTGPEWTPLHWWGHTILRACVHCTHTLEDIQFLPCVHYMASTQLHPLFLWCPLKLGASPTTRADKCATGYIC